MLMDISDLACDHYKKLVYDTPNFVEYFRSTTPESELGNLNIGSRPSRRNNKGGVETLRAIPWVFAWTQNRCHLPVWLGVGFALNKEIENGKIEVLKDMFHHWPFFNSMIDLISMVITKADPRIFKHYDDVLVEEKLKEIGDSLRSELVSTESAILSLTNEKFLLAANPVVLRAVKTRIPFLYPLHLLQVDFLNQLRTNLANDEQFVDPVLTEILMITIQGIAAGMQNTG